MALVLTVSSAHHLQLQGVVPATGVVRWTVPYSASYITPGVYIAPVAISGVTIALEPASTASSPSIKVKGISVKTGKTLWSDPSSLVGDVPTTCSGGREFCVDEDLSGQGLGVVVLTPATGKVRSFVPGLARALMPGLYQTTSSPTPTLKGVGATGKVGWTKTFSRLFGGSKYNPDGGWEFLSEGAVDVGSVGDVGSPRSAPPIIPLGQLKTIGIAPGSGKIIWHDPGEFDCMGTVVLSAPIICKYAGSAHFHGTKLSLAGVALTLEGVNAKTGAIRWSHKVADVSQLTLGSSLRILDGEHVLVTLAGGRKDVLDVATGRLRAASPNLVFWCESQSTYTVTAVTNDPSHGSKVGTPRYAGCTATASSTTSDPTTGSKTFGVELGGRFLWPSPHGLESARIPSD